MQRNAIAARLAWVGRESDAVRGQRSALAVIVLEWRSSPVVIGQGQSVVAKSQLSPTFGKMTKQPLASIGDSLLPRGQDAEEGERRLLEFPDTWPCGLS